MHMRDQYYILKGKLAVPVKNSLEWAIWFETADRHVAHTQIGGCWISTIFLGLDHSFRQSELPWLFETMIFRGGEGRDCWCCGTWEEAEKQHADAVALVRQEIKESIHK